MVERRRFSRVTFTTHAQIYSHQQVWDTQIIDLSLNGALIVCPDNFNSQADNYTLSFELTGSQETLSFSMELVHLDEQVIGLTLIQADIESISHLRRILELNLGDYALLTRQVGQLLSNQTESDTTDKITK